jgi:hypothetical protein
MNNAQTQHRIGRASFIHALSTPSRKRSSIYNHATHQLLLPRRCTFETSATALQQSGAEEMG